jgi:hypothetical protein
MSVSLAKHGRNSAECAMAAVLASVPVLVVYRGTYGGRPCTLRPLADTARGTHYMAYDRDPGFGAIAFPVSAGFEITGYAVRCPACGVFEHLAAWPCTEAHGA